MPSGATRLCRAAWPSAVDLPNPAPATTVVTGELNRCCSRSSRSARTSSPDTGWGTLLGMWSARSTGMSDLLRARTVERGGRRCRHPSWREIRGPGWCGRSAGMIATTRDGRELYYERHGAGTPIVVFEAGMGFSRNSWGAVIPGVCEHTTVIAYDRSGLGRSAPDAAPRNLDRLADDLVDLLDHLGDGPYVLVGHRWGGPIIRVTAAQRPERIAGLVLVDPTDERCDVFFSKGSERQQRWAPSVMRALAYTRILRLMVRAESKVLSEPWRTGLRKEDGTV